MLLTINDIQLAITQGRIAEHRNTNVELKESWAEGHGTKVSALANKQGIDRSWLLIGITDAGQMAGRDEKWARQTEQVMSQHFNQKLDPVQACVSINCLENGGGWFVAAELVPPGAVVKWGGRAYKAAGTTQAEMGPDEVLELTIRLPGLSDYSKQNWQGGVDAGLVASFAATLAEKRPNDPSLIGVTNLDATGVLERVRLQQKQAARILFGETQYRLVALDAAGQVLQNDTKSGTWSILLDSACDEIQAIADRVGQGHADPYSHLALREALANMVAHAAYFERDGELTIEIGHDYVALSNLCLPESGAFANKWFSRSHKSTNALLMEVLRLAGRVDELGRGKTLIIQESIIRGRKPPQVYIEPAGRFHRWKLVIPGGPVDSRTSRLLQRLRSIFQSEQHALIALALMHWRTEPVSEIRKYIDEESARAFVEALEEPRGPLYFDKKGDRLHLNRWAKVLVGEGKDSKRLSSAEEEQIYRMAYRIHTKFHNSIMTSEEFRELASFGDTASEKSLCSSTLTRWVKNGWLQRVKRGLFQFVRRSDFDAEQIQKEHNAALAQLLGSLAGGALGSLAGGALGALAGGARARNRSPETKS